MGPWKRLGSKVNLFSTEGVTAVMKVKTFPVSYLIQNIDSLLILWAET